MKKLFKGLICAGLCSTLALAGAFGCNNKPGNTTTEIESAHRNPETDALKLAIGAKDGNFNPLFYTAANDGTIANMTQASLLTADADGKLAFGDNYPTVTLDYMETYYDKNGTQIGTGDGRDIDGTGAIDGSTAYEFVIKNGVKFSDGVDLTVMDVLFNLYVYLDPLYSGSATIYSTKIQGLQAYRQQDKTAEDGGHENLDPYYDAADQRIRNLIDWSNEKTSEVNQDDLNTVKELYAKELKTDWNNLSTSWTQTYKDYRFTSAWQAFFFTEGLADWQYAYNKTNNRVRRFYDENDNGKKDDGEKYITEFDPKCPESEPLTVDPATLESEMNDNGKALTKEMADRVTTEKIEEFKAAHEGYSDADARLAVEGEEAIDYVLTQNTERSGISKILTQTATASTAWDEFVKDAMSVKPEDGLTVERISGITISRSDKFHGKDLGEEHDILKIMISGVDPKAKWNFSLAIAPMHYYSNAALTKEAMDEYAAYKKGDVQGNALTHFGVQYKNKDFMNDVLADPDKTNLPVGAGAYKCTSYKMDGSKPTGSTFNYNKICYYERNEYFTTFGSGVDNAKIKYVSYKEMPDDQIVNALKTGEIDYGTPIAKAANQTEVHTGTLRSTSYMTGGYGYVGINPKSEKLRSVYVRQAIMYSFNTSAIEDYYGQDLVKLINRPMSLTSWASPENPDYVAPENRPERYYQMTPEVLENYIDEYDFIRQLVGKSGTYGYDEDKEQIVDKISGSQLEITFTIAGETSDHPSYNMFIEAKAFLEECGFKINVETSALALNLLTTGDLEVWAAAWSSSIDPDPYQIYSMYSNASSTKNWYKKGIQDDGGNGELKYEYLIAQELTAKIEKGREQLNENDRRNTYGKSTTTERLYDVFDKYSYGDEFNETLKNLCTLDLIMEMAVEFPTYQRNELCVYNAAVLDESTMRLGKAATHNMGPIDELYKVGYRP